MPVFRAEVPRTDPPAHQRPMTPHHPLKESSPPAGRAFQHDHGFAARGTRRDLRRCRRRPAGADKDQAAPTASTETSSTDSALGRASGRSLPWPSDRPTPAPARPPANGDVQRRRPQTKAMLAVRGSSRRCRLLSHSKPTGQARPSVGGDVRSCPRPGLARPERL
jgi:hypothetical protein